MGKSKINTNTPAIMHLINGDGVIIPRGEIVRCVVGAKIGTAYRYEGVIIYRSTHRVRCVRRAAHSRGLRGVEFLAPESLGCSVMVPLTRCQRAKVFAVACWTKIDDWFMAGVIALVPLAWFEHFHMAAKITEVLSLGVFGTGHGGGE